MGKAIKIILLLILILLISFVIMFVFINNESSNDYDPLPTDTFTIGFNSNGGVLENDVSVTKVSVGSNILDNISSLNITGTKVGYTLDGWLLNSSTGIRVTKENTMPNSDIVLYANWLEDEDEIIPPLEPGEILIINNTIVFGVNILSYVTTLVFDKIVSRPVEGDEKNFVINLILNNLTQDAINYEVTYYDILFWFNIIINDNYIIITNNTFEIPFALR